MSLGAPPTLLEGPIAPLREAQPTAMSAWRTPGHFAMPNSMAAASFCARQRHATAYATLFTGQAARPRRTTSAGNTFIGSKMFRRDHSSLPEHALLRPIQLLLVLHRSIRRVEQCRRDFLVLLGTGVVLPEKERAALAREPGLRLVPTPPVFEGVPTADKLHAWALTSYSQLLVLDSDVMVLRPLDGLFAEHERAMMAGSTELVIAHHPYDALQAQCGVPPASRGVAALLLLRPNHTLQRELLSFLQTRFTQPHQLMYADQTGLMCFFHNRSTAHTLPCHFLYDADNPLRRLDQWVKQCRLHLGQHLRRQCLAPDPVACAPKRDVPHSLCAKTAAHLTQRCAWSKTAARGVYAVHFKAKGKPWPPSRQAVDAQCRPLMMGRLRAVHVVERDCGGRKVHDELERALTWDEDVVWRLEGGRHAGRCVTTTNGARVLWAARHGGSVPRICCHYRMLLAAEWNEVLVGPNRSDASRREYERAEALRCAAGKRWACHSERLLAVGTTVHATRESTL